MELLVASRAHVHDESMQMASSQRLRLAVCALALAACAPGAEVEPSDEPSTESSSVVVRNDYLGEVDIYAVAGGTRTRIGTVQSGQTREFAIPRPLLARTEIQFQIDPEGPAASFTLRPISLVPGNTIELSVAPNLAMSSISVVRN
jgi:hypothetical protein